MGEAMTHLVNPPPDPDVRRPSAPGPASDHPRHADAVLGFSIMVCSAAAVLATLGYQLVVGFAVGVIITMGAAVITGPHD